MADPRDSDRNETKTTSEKRVREVILWYVKEWNLALEEGPSYATDFWRDVQDRILG